MNPIQLCRTCDGTRDDCQSTEPISLQLEVVSLRPSVFIIDNFLNDFEVATIIGIAEPRIADSIVGVISLIVPPNCSLQKLMQLIQVASQQEPTKVIRVLL